MTYIFPILYVIVSYTFVLFTFLANLYNTPIEVKLFSVLLPFIMGVINLVVVLSLGRKWPRKTLLNCTMIIKYGLIPFYLVGGALTLYVTMIALFPLPFMIFFGLISVGFLIFGYGIILGSAPYSIAYIVKSYKEGVHPKWLAVLSGICQFFFTFDVVSMMVLTVKEKHLVKTTLLTVLSVCIVVLCAIGYIIYILLGN